MTDGGTYLDKILASKRAEMLHKLHRFKLAAVKAELDDLREAAGDSPASSRATTAVARA